MDSSSSWDATSTRLVKTSIARYETRRVNIIDTTACRRVTHWAIRIKATAVVVSDPSDLTSTLDNQQDRLLSAVHKRLLNKAVRSLNYECFREDLSQLKMQWAGQFRRNFSLQMQKIPHLTGTELFAIFKFSTFKFASWRNLHCHLLCMQTCLRR